VDPDGHSPVDVAFFAIDVVKLGAAVYSGTDIGAALVDVGLSAVGVVVPVPGAGVALKTGRAAERASEVAHAVEAGASFAAKGGLGRSGALNEAKRDLGIPRSQHPDSVGRIPMTDRNGKRILGTDGKPIMTREYTYMRPDGSKVVVQDHSAGHRFGQGGVGDRGSHFNVRPPEDTRTASVPGIKDHYSW